MVLVMMMESVAGDKGFRWCGDEWMAVEGLQ